MARARNRLFSLSFLSIVAFVLFSHSSHAQEAELPCTPEPTVMNFGEIFKCDIDPVTDLDIFEFTGTAGDIVVLTLTDRSSGGTFNAGNDPVAKVFAPGNFTTPLATLAPDETGVTQQLTLPTTGTYTIWVTDANNNETITYSLALQRLDPNPPNGRKLSCNSILENATISPVADSDVLLYEGTAGDIVVLTLTDRSSGGTFNAGNDPVAKVFAPGNFTTPLATLAPDETGVTQQLTLPTTGTYTIWVTDANNNETITYSLALQRVSPTCPVCQTDAQCSDGLPCTIESCQSGTCKLTGAPPDQCEPPPPHKLTVIKAGNGVGTVTSSPTGINCGIDCMEDYPEGTQVSLSTTQGSDPITWSPNCAGGQVTMTADVICTATFNPAPPNFFPLTVLKAGNGTGTVISEPVGINCGSDCTEDYLANTLVTLIATPNTNHSFAGWTGNCGDDGPLMKQTTITMDAAKTCTATFTTATPPQERIVLEMMTTDTALPDGTTLTVATLPPSTITVKDNGCKGAAVPGLSGTPVLVGRETLIGCRTAIEGGNLHDFVPDDLEFTLCVRSHTQPACERIWSSNPANNSDGFPHLQITPLHSAEFPGQIYQLAWETGDNGGDMDFNDLIVVMRLVEDVGADCVDCNTLDQDGDGLWDDWEMFGVDVNGDGIITPGVDLDLPSLGAKEDKPDLFLELDYMDCAVAGSDCSGAPHSHQPKPEAVTLVKDAFDAGGEHRGPFKLHLAVDEAIPHKRYLAFTSGATDEFAAAKDAYFFHGNQRHPRRFAYHYGLFTHQLSPGVTMSGRAERPGNDVLVSFGEWHTGQPLTDLDGDGLNDVHVGTVQEQAGTLLHELGHNLRLDHGGSIDINRKSNYPSVMSYAFQLSGVRPAPAAALPGADELPPGLVTYSNGYCQKLDEHHLNETAGSCPGSNAPPFWTQYFCPDGSVRANASTDPVDWNCDGDRTDTDLQSDINKSNLIEMLNDHDDWANLRFVFQATNDFEDGVQDTVDEIVEIAARPPGPTINPEPIASSKDSILRKAPKQGNEGANRILAVSKKERTVVAFDLAAAPNPGITQAKLILTVAQARLWAAAGGPVAVHRVLTSFPEGNGVVWKAKPPKTKGTGEGVTWFCANDPQISDPKVNCATPWNGGETAINPTATGSVQHFNTLADGTIVEWDVTVDVRAALLDGKAEVAWLLKAGDKEKGQVTYYSKEGSQTGKAPQLVLKYD